MEERIQCKRCGECLHPSWVDKPSRTVVCPACLTCQRVVNTSNHRLNNKESTASIDWFRVEKTPDKIIFSFPSRPHGRLVLVVLVALFIFLLSGWHGLLVNPLFWLAMVPAYWFVVKYWNQTKVTISDELVMLESSPLPFPRSRFARDRIAGVYCKRHVSNAEGSDIEHFSLWLRLNRGFNRKLLAGEENRDHVLFVESELESALFGCEVQQSPSLT